MKMLCLLVILTNIFVFLWEYRSGALMPTKETSEQSLAKGKEQIFLISETKDKSESGKYNPAPDIPLNKPTTNFNFNQMENLSSNQTVAPLTQLP